MSCCGQKRQALAASSTGPETPDANSASNRSIPAANPPTNVLMAGSGRLATPSSRADSGPTVTLVSPHGISATVTGQVTGKQYRFHGAGSMAAVDRRDADAMIASGACERVWG